MPRTIKIITGILSFSALALCMWVDGLQIFTVESAVAQGGASTNTTNMMTQMASVAVLIASGMEVLAFMIFDFLRFFLDPLFILDITNSEGLNRIWQYSRNIMNVIFAFMLLASGIYTVVMGNEDFVKQKFPKFVLAVVLVNFSWFFPRVILDVSNVLTATVYQLPAGLSPTGTIECERPPKIPGGAGEPCTVVKDIRYFTGCPPKDNAGNLIPGFKTKFGVVCYREEPWSNTTNTSYGVLNGLVMNYGKLTNLTRVLRPAAAPVAGVTRTNRDKQLMIFLMHIILILALMAMLFLPLAAMFVVFLIRIPIIWVTVAFMPFMFLGFVIGDKMGSFDSMKIFKHFVQAAFLPAAVAVPFAVGFIILTEITKLDCPTIAAPLCDPTGPLLHNVETMWGLFMLLIAFFVIWMGFWAAISIDDIYVNVTSGIKSLGQSVGSSALKLPLSIPIPLGGGKSISALGVKSSIDRFGSQLSGGASPIAAAKAAIPGGKAALDAREMSAAINTSGKDTNEALKDILNEMKRTSGGRAVDSGLITTKINQTFANAKIKAELPEGTTAKQFEDSVRASSEFKDVIADLEKGTTTP